MRPAQGEGRSATVVPQTDYGELMDPRMIIIIIIDYATIDPLLV